MSPGKWLLLSCVLIGVVVFEGRPDAQAPAAAFYTIGDLPGGGSTTIVRDATKANGVIYAVGGAVARRTCVPSGLCPGPDTPVLWRSDDPNALQALPDYVVNANTSAIQAFAITPDAKYIASQARDLAASIVTRATRVTSADLPSTAANLNLGIAPYSPPGPASAAVAISSTGSVLYGSRQAAVNGASGPRAVRFDTVAGATTDVPTPAGVTAFNSVAGARATSNNGVVAVGWTFTGATDHRAFTYDHNFGTSVQIPLLPGGTANDALAVGPSGGIVLVTGNSAEYPNGEAYIAFHDSASNTNGIVERLGSPNALWNPGGRMCVRLEEGTACQPTTLSSFAGLAVSGNTRIVAMNFSGDDGQYAYVHNPFGWFHLSSILAANSINTDLAGWSDIVVSGMSRDATLVYGFGSLNGSVTGWVAEFAPGVLALFNPAPAPPADSSIVGGWRCSDPSEPLRCALIFTADGAYYHIERGNPGDPRSGFERGYYSFYRNRLTLTTLVDTNGSTGGSDADGYSVLASISGDVLIVDGEPTAQRIPGLAGTLDGAWVQGMPTQPDASIAVVFDSGTYLMAWDDRNFEANVDGMEAGQFAWDPATGHLVPDISSGIHISTSGGDGLSDFAAEGPIFLAITPDGLGLDTGQPNEPPIRRVIDPATIPVIANTPLSANGAKGSAFVFDVDATNTSTFSASGLPDGLSIDGTSGVVVGTPAVGGQFVATIKAANAAGVADIETLTLTLAIPTEAGMNVAVEPVVPEGQGPITITFGEVTGAGETTVEAVSLDDLAENNVPPPGSVDVGGVIYEVQTTASYTGLIELCFSYDGIDFGDAEPRLFHYENNVWVDITTSVDTVTKTICGATTSLSPFAILKSNVVRKGFYAPVNPIAGFLNTVKGGSAVPLKFEVFVNGAEQTTTEGLEPIVQAIACDPTAPEDPVEVTPTLAGSGLRYDSAAGQFILNWKAPKTPGCYLVQIKTTQDQLALTARFRVRQ